MSSRISTNSEENLNSENINSFMALKKYKETDDQVEMMKRRFKVLQAKDEEYRAKTIQNQQKIRLYQQVQRQKNQAQSALKNSQLKKQQQISIWRQKNTKLKQSIKDKIIHNTQSIVNEKKQLNKQMRDKSRENQIKYRNIKKQDVETKKYARDKVVNDQKKQREKINQYKSIKYSQTLNNKSLDSQDLMIKKRNKEKQLQELMKLEMSMLSRNSQSIQLSDGVKHRLREVTGHHKKQTNLPEISSHKNNSRGSGSTQL